MTEDLREGRTPSSARTESSRTEAGFPWLKKPFFLEVSGLIKPHKLCNNRSVMPLDVLGRTRATMTCVAGALSSITGWEATFGPAVGCARLVFPVLKWTQGGFGSLGKSLKIGLVWACILQRLHQRGISGTHGSSTRADSVPAVCTHRPSLLLIE